MYICSEIFSFVKDISLSAMIAPAYSFDFQLDTSGIAEIAYMFVFFGRAAIRREILRILVQWLDMLSKWLILLFSLVTDSGQSVYNKFS